MPVPTPTPTPHIVIGTPARAAFAPILVAGRKVGSLTVSRDGDTVTMTARFQRDPGDEHARLCAKTAKVSHCRTRHVVLRHDIVFIATAPFTDELIGKVRAGRARGTVTV